MGLRRRRHGCSAKIEDFPRLQHLAQLRFHGLRVRRDEEVAGTQAAMLLGWNAAELGDGPVHPQDAQVRCELGQADRGPAEEPVEDRPVRLPLDHLRCGSSDEEPLATRLAPDDGSGPAPDLQAMTTAVPHGYQAEPSAVAHARRDRRHHHGPIAGVDQDVAGRRAEHLVGRIAEERLGLLTPSDDPPTGVQHHRGGATHGERILRPLAERRRRCVHRDHLAAFRGAGRRRLEPLIPVSIARTACRRSPPPTG